VPTPGFPVRTRQAPLSRRLNIIPCTHAARQQIFAHPLSQVHWTSLVRARLPYDRLKRRYNGVYSKRQRPEFNPLFNTSQEATVEQCGARCNQLGTPKIALQLKSTMRYLRTPLAAPLSLRRDCCQAQPPVGVLTPGALSG
jgi:hypothetical protein